MIDTQFHQSGCAMPRPLHAPSAAPLVTRTPAIPRLSLRAGLLRYRSDRVGLLAELGDERVDIVESALGPLRLIVITEARLARSVLVEHSDAFRKGPAVSRHGRPLLGNGLLSSVGEDHRRDRKLLAPRFSPRHIARFARIMRELTWAMLARWRDRPPTCFDDEIAGLTMSIAARTMFGADVSPGDIATLSAGLIHANHWLLDQATSIMPVPLWVPTPRNLRMREVLRAIDSVVYRMIADHRAGRTEEGVLEALLAARDEHGAGMDDQMLRDQVVTFFIAGHETIAATLGWAYRLLRERPEVADRIAAEAGSVRGAPDPASDNRPPGDLDVKQLVYTRAVLQEIMRLRPAAYMIGRQATRDVAVGDHPVPAGSYIVVNPLGMHRRADYFPDPLVFRPERFLDEPTWPRAAYQPFGAGPRVCIGNHFAMLEGTLVLALLCRAARFVGRVEPDERGFGGPDGSPGARGGFAAHPLVTLRPADRIPLTVQWRRA